MRTLGHHRTTLGTEPAKARLDNLAGLADQRVLQTADEHHLNNAGHEVGSYEATPV
jgi:hypothetical protein